MQLQFPGRLTGQPLPRTRAGTGSSVFRSAATNRNGRAVRGLLLFLRVAAGTGLLERALARAGDLAGRRQARLGQALFLRQVVVLDEGLVLVGVELGEEEVLDEADLGFDVVDGDGLEGGWGLEDVGGGRGGTKVTAGPKCQ